MTDNIVKLPNVNDMKVQGAVWLARLDRGLSTQEEAQIRIWLDESPQHRDFFVELAKEWDQLSVLSQLSDLMPYQKKAKKSRWPTYAKVASVALICLLGSFFFSATGVFNFGADSGEVNLVHNQTYRTVVGEKTTIHLPDSSVLTLNTNSVIRVNYSQSRRELILERGEAHIDVAHNKTRKLVMSAGDRSFVAIGTAFNVKYSDTSSVELIVTEGKVGIADASKVDEIESFFAQARQSDNDQLLVNAGERVIITQDEINHDSQITKENIAKDVADSLAWRTGKLIFKGDSLENVVAEMSRYSDISFEIKGEQLKTIRIGGRFNTGDIEGLLDVLDQQFNIKANKLDALHIELSLSKAQTKAI